MTEFAVNTEMTDVVFVRKARIKHFCAGGHDSTQRIPCSYP